MRNVQLPEDLCQQAEKKYSARFDGLEPFLTFVLQQLVSEKAAEMDRAEQRYWKSDYAI
jgi:hypothetical protein